PAPVHYGNTLLVEQRDFRLAYPIAKRGEELRDKMDAKKKPPPYKSISKNRWVSRKRIHGEVPVCICEPSSNCGEECMNRVLQYICNPKQCPCGERCTNISLAKRAKVTTTVTYVSQRGFGLQTQQRIQKDQFIDEYRGEVINLAECARRVTDFYKATGNFYFLDYDNAAGEVLDGGLKGNITRFANHSCDPNCYIEKWLVCGSDEERDAEFQIGLYALRDIEPGEELTYDY
ncbi:SET domain-containing protein, partial [Ceraceosorus guamensis]